MVRQQTPVGGGGRRRPCRLCHRIDVHRRTDRYRRGTSQQRQWDGDGEQNRIDGANPMSTQTLSIVCMAQGCTNVLGSVVSDTKYGNYPAWGYLRETHAEAVQANAVDPAVNPAVPLDPRPLYQGTQSKTLAAVTDTRTSSRCLDGRNVFPQPAILGPAPQRRLPMDAQSLDSPIDDRLHSSII